MIKENPISENYQKVIELIDRRATAEYENNKSADGFSILKSPERDSWLRPDQIGKYQEWNDHAFDAANDENVTTTRLDLYLNYLLRLQILKGFTIDVYDQAIEIMNRSASFEDFNKEAEPVMFPYLHRSK